MFKRIRYVEQDNILISKKAYESGDMSISVRLNKETKTFELVDLITQTTIMSGGHTINMAVLKKQAKEALMTFGISFEEDVRDNSKKEGGPNAT